MTIDQVAVVLIAAARWQTMIIKVCFTVHMWDQMITGRLMDNILIDVLFYGNL